MATRVPVLIQLSDPRVAAQLVPIVTPKGKTMGFIYPNSHHKHYIPPYHKIKCFVYHLINTLFTQIRNIKTTITVWARDAKGEIDTTRSTLNMKVTGTRPRGCPKMRWLDRLKSDMRIYGINLTQRWPLTENAGLSWWKNVDNA